MKTINQQYQDNNDKVYKNLIDKYIIISITDTKGIITDVSDAFVKISGYTREELIGQPHNIIRHPNMNKDTFKDLWSTIKSGKTWKGEIVNLAKDGSSYWVIVTIEPIFGNNGKIISYMAVRQDITDKIKIDTLNKTLEDKVRHEVEKNREKDKAMLQQSKLAQMGELLAMIAHQWRQPLSAVSANANDLILKIMLNNYDDEYFDKKLKLITDLSQHLSKTIDDFRGFYKNDKEKVEILFSNIVEDVLKIVSISIENKEIKIYTDFNCNLKINTYSNEMRQVVLNLIKNAEDILVEKKIEMPYINIKTFNDEKNSYLLIKDNGGGIPEDIITKIFDPYFSTKMKKDGTGLGLYMSKIIIEEHCNGKLEAYNEKDGAVFKITMPLSKN